MISNSALRMTPDHLEELAQIAAQRPDPTRSAPLFNLVAQIRGEKPSAPPNLRVVAGG